MHRTTAGHGQDSTVAARGETGGSAARRRGAEAAAAFSAALREREREERAALLARPEPPRGSPGPSAELLRLRRQVEHLTEFRTAVLGSRGWRLLQGLRRLAGRAW